MFSRLCNALMLSCLVVLPVGAQTVRFDTNVGNIDFLLNPTNNPNLQGHVDNILAYVNAGRYDLSLINRADTGPTGDPSDDFVLQFGNFLTNTITVGATFAEFTSSIETFDPVVVDAAGDGTVDFDITDLNNTRGTVSLALNAIGANSGTSSFFVNLGDNSGADPTRANLDGQNFIPFAVVEDLSTVDLILALNQANLADAALASSNIPLLSDNRLVIVERAFVLDEAAEAAALALAGDGTEVQAALAADPVVEAANVAVQAIAVPEPPALVLAIGALVFIAVMKPAKARRF